MAGLLGRSAFGWWRFAPTRERTHSAEKRTVQDLIASLKAAADSGGRLSQTLGASHESQPLANAASICRWELLTLRERLVGWDLPRGLQATRSEILHHLEGAATAAQRLSHGYRFHNLDRICNGGQGLDNHLAALEHLCSRLARAG